MQVEQVIKDINLNPIEKKGLLEKLGNLSKKGKILAVVAFVVGLLLLVLLVGSVVMNKGGGEKQVEMITPTPVLVEELEEIIEPSLYATDSAVLEIEKEIKETKDTLENIDRSQKNLDIPTLDMNLTLEK